MNCPITNPMAKQQNMAKVQNPTGPDAGNRKALPKAIADMTHVLMNLRLAIVDLFICVCGSGSGDE